MNYRRGQYIFAIIVGLLVATLAYRWIMNPDGRLERAQQERVVVAARTHLTDVVSDGDLEIVDPLAPNRRVGKVYVYREDVGWAVSGYYRRDADDKWHPYLLQLDAELGLQHLKAGDAALVPRAAGDAKLEAMP